MTLSWEDVWISSICGDKAWNETGPLCFSAPGCVHCYFELLCWDGLAIFRHVWLHTIQKTTQSSGFQLKQLLTYQIPSWDSFSQKKCFISYITEHIILYRSVNIIIYYTYTLSYTYTGKTMDLHNVNVLRQTVFKHDGKIHQIYQKIHSFLWRATIYWI